MFSSSDPSTLYDPIPSSSDKTTTGTSNNVSDLTADEIKEQGNVCVRKGNYEEALSLYTQAIEINPKDSTLYSNRSLAFLKLKQFYYASQDADSAIQLNPTWVKGHFRKAEVLTAVGHYDLALLYYGRAIQLQPGDRNLLLSAQKAATLGQQQSDYEFRLPWVGAGVGIILGVIISLFDVLLTKNPTLNHPALMVLLVIAIACIGYTIAGALRCYHRLHKKSLLDPPLEPIEKFTKQTESDKYTEVDPGSSTTTNRTRYSKSQARLRFKKGKL